MFSVSAQIILGMGKDAGMIGIDFVCTRPGEKLHEELWGEGEQVFATAHPKIRRVSGPVVDAAWLDEELAELERLVEGGETLEVVSRLTAMSRAPQYAPAPDTVLEDTLH